MIKFLQNTYNKFTAKAWSHWEPDAAWVAQSAKIEEGIQKATAWMPDFNPDITPAELHAVKEKAKEAIRKFEEPITAKAIEVASGAKQWFKYRVASW